MHNAAEETQKTFFSQLDFDARTAECWLSRVRDVDGFRVTCFTYVSFLRVFFARNERASNPRSPFCERSAGKRLMSVSVLFRASVPPKEPHPRWRIFSLKSTILIVGVEFGSGLKYNLVLFVTGVFRWTLCLLVF